MIRIALVDDYPMIRNALKHYLALWEDMTVIMEASNGQDFINRLFITSDSDIPDIVVMDAQMPVMDGYQATRYISLHYPGIKVLGMSADVDVEPKMLDCGATCFLPKGIDGDEIVKTIHQMVYA